MGVKTYYELYLDSLFLLNFGMNLYLLLLVNRSTFRTATRMRLVLGAAVGAVSYLLPFLGKGTVLCRLLPGLLAGTVGMLFAAFPIGGVSTFMSLLGGLLRYTFLMGGSLLFLCRSIVLVTKHVPGVWEVLSMGAALYLLFSRLEERKRKGKEECFVTLKGENGSIRVAALVDSGNSLTEPVSGKPVSVIDREVLHCLWKEPPVFFRAVPYHSIGKKHGILKGYLIPEIQIEIGGMTKICREIYVAAGDESIAGMEEGMPKGAIEETAIRLLLHPALLKEKTSDPLMNWRKRERET